MGLVTSLRPIVDERSRVLVLGSMPGERSLQANQYYAHPRNRFWRVMAATCGGHPELPYAHRVEGLLGCGIGLWDVIERCIRVGSLDTSIVSESVVPNDLPGLLAGFPAVQAVALNGRKAADSFRRLIVPDLPAETIRRLTFLEMPSTSPANASRSLGALVQEWSRIEAYLP